MLCLALASNGNLAQHGRLAPAEIEHLAVLQARHAATLAALGSAAPSPPDYTCKEGVHSVPEPWKVQGTSLGGWLVLEPWVTPSLFYQFEGRPANETAMDMHGFCRVLGAQEANRQLRIHWEKWVTEEHLAELASRGINALRVPVGDWMWTPYWPYHGCADGAVDQLKRVLRHSQKLGLRVLIDLHGARQLCALTPGPRARAPLARACRAIGYLPTLTVARSLARSQACGALRTASTTAGRR